MENYDTLLNEIKQYLKREEVVKESINSEVISAYDLYNIINEELEDLRSIMINSKIDKKLKFHKFLKSFREKQIYTFLTEDNKKNGLYFCEHDSYFHDESVELIVYKDKNVDDIYFSKSKNHHNKIYYNFISKNYDLIMETFQIFEKYIDLLGSISTFDENIKDDLFNINIYFGKSGNVNINIEVLQEHPLCEEYSKKWYNKQGIYEFVDNNKEEILKRIPVYPHMLNEPFKNLYNDYKEKTCNQKVLKI